MKISIHKISMLILYIYIILLPVDIALGNIIGYISIINYFALMYLFVRSIEILKSRKINLRNFKNNKYILVYSFYMIFMWFFRAIEEYNSFYLLSFLMNFITSLVIIESSYSDSDINNIKKSVFLSIFSIIIMYFLVGSFKMGRLALNANKNSDPNFFAVGLCLVTSIYAYNLIFNNKKIYSATILGLLFLIIFMTGSRSGLIANFFVIISMFCFSNTNLKKKIFVVLIILFFCIIFYNYMDRIIPKKIISRFSLEAIEKNDGSGRFNIWKSALLYYSNNASFGREIFGHGMATFNSLKVYKGHSSHNVFINNLIEGGIIGEFLFIMSLYKTLVYSFKSKNIIIFSALIGLIFGSMRCRFDYLQDIVVFCCNWMCN